MGLRNLEEADVMCLPILRRFVRPKHVRGNLQGVRGGREVVKLRADRESKGVRRQKRDRRTNSQVR